MTCISHSHSKQPVIFYLRKRIKKSLYSIWANTVYSQLFSVLIPVVIIILHSYYYNTTTETEASQVWEFSDTYKAFKYGALEFTVNVAGAVSNSEDHQLNTTVFIFITFLFIKWACCSYKVLYISGSQCYNTVACTYTTRQWLQIKLDNGCY
jgi:hypothetical protein